MSNPTKISFKLLDLLESIVFAADFCRPPENFKGGANPL